MQQSKQCRLNTSHSDITLCRTPLHVRRRRAEPRRAIIHLLDRGVVRHAVPILHRTAALCLVLGQARVNEQRRRLARGVRVDHRRPGRHVGHGARGSVAPLALDNAVGARQRGERREWKKRVLPPHDGRGGHAPSALFALVVLVPIRLVNDLLRDDLLNDV